MALGSALVDRARIIRQEAAQAARVEGSTVLARVEGNWFRARLELPQGTEGQAPDSGRRRGVRAPTLMFESFDEENLDVTLTLEDYVEVESEQYGTTVWRVDGNPQPIRKLRAVIGFQANLRRVEQRELRRAV